MESCVKDLTDAERIYAVYGNTINQCRCELLVDFIKQFEITDLHSSNWGITRDGGYVMIDFSGYPLQQMIELSEKYGMKVVKGEGV